MILPTEHSLPAWSKSKLHQNQAAAVCGFAYAGFDLNA